jgi:hypothetical protein
MFMEQFLDWIDRGGILRNIVGYLLRAIGVLLIVGAVVSFLLHIYQWFKVFEYSWAGLGLGSPAVSESIFSTLQTLLAGPAYIIIQCLFYYMLIHTIYLRADNILNLDTSNYTVIPIFTQVLRLGGDLSVVTGIVWSVHLFVHAVFSTFGAVLYSLFDIRLLPYGVLFGAHEGPRTIQQLLETLYTFGPSFGQTGDWWFVLSLLLTGIFTMIVATFIQMVYYWLAELQIVLVDIARNTEAKSTGEE